MNYQLTLPPQWKIHLVFHVDLLTPYKETVFHGENYRYPPPDLINNEEHFEVERVPDSRMFRRRKTKQYLVKWTGYPDSDNQWVNKDDMNTEEAIHKYEQLKRAPQRASGRH